jgi:hypothetical protein
MSSQELYSPKYNSTGNPKPSIPELKDAIEKARLDVEDFAQKSQAARDEAVEAANDISTLGGIDGTAETRIDANTIRKADGTDVQAANHPGEVWYVVDETTYYESNGTDWNQTGPDLSDAVRLTKGTLGQDRLPQPFINIGETALTAQEGEAELRSLVTGADFGDEVVLQNGFEATLSGGPITIPEGVRIRGHDRQQSKNSPSIKKGADGAVLKYQDSVQLKSLFIHGNRSSYTGSNLVPTGGNSREVYMENVFSWYADEASLVWDETFLSTFINVSLLYSTDGLRVVGSGHSPHSLMLRSRMGYNDHAGIDIRYTLDVNHFVGCLIDQNLYGIDTIDCIANQPISGATKFTSTVIWRNDAPGIALRGTADRISLVLDSGTNVNRNAQNPPSSLTAPVGDIHSENGSRIEETIHGKVGDIRRKNSDGKYERLTIIGSAGDLELPDTYIMFLNEQNIGTVESSRSHFGFDPVGYGEIIGYKNISIPDIPDLSKDETFQGAVGIHGQSPASQGSLTAKDGAAVDATYGAEEEGVIKNNRTRIKEIEDKLKQFGLLT